MDNRSRSPVSSRNKPRRSARLSPDNTASRSSWNITDKSPLFLEYVIIGGLSQPEMGVYRLAEVRIQDGESIDNALRRFKRKVQQEDIIKEVKKHSFYLKPGERKRIKQALARKRSRKKVRREPVE